MGGPSGVAKKKNSIVKGKDFLNVFYEILHLPLNISAIFSPCLCVCVCLSLYVEGGGGSIQVQNI